MKPTDFSQHMTGFLTHHLAAQRNLSANTIKAYRDTFTLLLRFCRDDRGMALEQLTLKQIDVPLVEAFVEHLALKRHASIRTQNHRLAALHSFFRYVQAEVPELLLQCQQILSIPLRRQPRLVVEYLSKNQLGAILAQPDLHTVSGRRDAVLLSVLYDTGARVQELIDLSAGDVRLDGVAQVRLVGKGRKARAVPLMDATVAILRDHLRESRLDRPERFDEPLFRNSGTGKADVSPGGASATSSTSTQRQLGKRTRGLRSGLVRTRSDTPRECTSSRVVCRSRSSATSWATKA